MSDSHEIFISSRLATRTRKHSPRHRAGTGANRERQLKQERARAAAPPPAVEKGSGEARGLQDLVGQLTDEDLRFLARFVAFLAEQHAAVMRQDECWEPGGLQAAAAREPEIVREAVSMLIGPCDTEECAKDIALDLAGAPGFEMLLHSFRDGYHHLDGRTEDAAVVAAWVARRSGVASVELDLDLLRVVPQTQEL